MLEFQYLVIADQLHKEQLALRAAAMVPEENVLILYDRAVFDDKAYVSDDEVPRRPRLLWQDRGGNPRGLRRRAASRSPAPRARSSPTTSATPCATNPLKARGRWTTKPSGPGSAHPNLHIIDNSVDFEDKMTRGLRAVYECLGEKRRSSTGTNTSSTCRISTRSRRATPPRAST